jgi:hypothetical protein
MAAFGQTRLQIVNAALARLRETEVATTSSTTYANLIAKMLNSVKSEIETAWTWRDLRDTYEITATPGTTTYALTSSGQHARVLDMYNTTIPKKMTLGTFADFNKKFFAVSAVQTGDPTEYLPGGLDNNYDLQVDIWPEPVTTNTLKANLYIPQNDPTADATVLLIPNQVLIEGIIAYALAERGDDNGTAAQDQMARYRTMLSDAVAWEVGRDPSEQDWAPYE